MKKITVLFTVLTMSVFFAACGGDDGNSSTDGGDTTKSLTGSVTINDWVTAAPLEGVTLCLNVEGVECVVTDAEGTAIFSGEVAVGAAVQMTADKEGYFPFLIEFVVTDASASGTASYIMAKEDIVGTVISALGEEPNPEKGHLGVVAWGPVSEDGSSRPNLAGASMVLEGTATQGPKYYNLLADIANGIFAADATATTDAGMAGYFNVDPGTVSVTITAEGYDCTTPFNGVAGDNGAIDATVAAGRVTYVAVFCETE